MSSMELTRRRLIQVSAAMAALSSTAALAEGAKKAADAHAHHHHASNPKNAAVNKAALHCLEKSNVCLEHCFELLKEGDKELALCADLTADTAAMCVALAKLAASNSKRLPAMAKVCIDVCKDCEDECRKHEKKHVQCKDCADSCAECIKACKAVLA